MISYSLMLCYYNKKIALHRFTLQTCLSWFPAMNGIQVLSYANYLVTCPYLEENVFTNMIKFVDSFS